MIKVTNLTKIYKTGELEVVALEGVSFEIKKGEFVAIMGPSGSGKSTLMHILGALDVPTSGEYFLDGEVIADLSDDQLAEIRNKKVGFVFQFYNLLPRTTALKNVMIPMMYNGIPSEKREDIAKNYLKMVGLEDRMDHAPNQLSGGQQQRVAIARALAMNPSIILADEPTGNIATKQAIEVMKIFDDLNEKGHTIVVITHENEIAECTKRIIYLRDGRIEKDEINKNQRELNSITL
jgi:putative ABC transport system ATP-binding protein